jgi:hypothetical protein
VVRCCRHYYDLAVPILYSSFNGETKARSFAFLQTILKRPDLANYGQHLTGLDNNSDLYPEFFDMYSRPRFRFNTSIKGLKAALENGCNDKRLRDRWFHTFSLSRCYQGNKWLDVPGNWDSITALLLLLLPNLSTFKLPIYNEKSTDYEFEFISYVFTEASRLQNSNINSAYSLNHLLLFRNRTFIPDPLANSSSLSMASHTFHTSTGAKMYRNHGSPPKYGAAF